MTQSLKEMLKATKHLPYDLAYAYMALVDAALPLGVIPFNEALLRKEWNLEWAALIPRLIEWEMIEVQNIPHLNAQLLIPATLLPLVKNRIRAHLTPNSTQLSSWKEIDTNFVYSLQATPTPLDNKSKLDKTTLASSLSTWAERLRLNAEDKLLDRRQFMLHIEQEVPYLIFVYPAYFIANLPKGRVTVAYEEEDYVCKVLSILMQLKLEELPCVQKTLQTAPIKGIHHLVKALHDAHNPEHQADTTEKTPSCPQRRIRHTEKGKTCMENHGTKRGIPKDIDAKTSVRQGLSRHFGLPI